jgi:tellurite resistance protein TerC
MFETLWPWVAFNLFVLALLALDLGVFNRKAHEVSVKEALWYSAFWISLALAFGVLVYFTRGSGDAVNYITGYLIEKSLSVDNLFVLLLIFSYFQIPAKYQHRVLFWGIIGAIVLRMAFIVAGIALIKMFYWVIYVFGAFLVYSGVKMAFHDEAEQVDLEKNPVLRLFRKLMPVTAEFEDGKFIVRKDGVKQATPLFVTLLLVETSDVLFATDSIPAIFAITLDPFIVYTSNIFAILGLRSLYFALAGIMGMFHYLNYGLSVILASLGIKMLASGFFHIPVTVSLLFIAVTLAISVLASVMYPRAKDVDAGNDIIPKS